MIDWHTTCLGLRRLPRELTAFEIEAFFNFSPDEWRVIEGTPNTAVIRQLFNHQESEKRQCLAGLCTSILGISKRTSLHAKRAYP